MLHVNATAFGGGVAEILGTLVPLMNDIGLNADWQVIKGADEFFNVTKAMHNSLQGMYYDWTPAMREIWLNYNKLNADLFDDDVRLRRHPRPATGGDAHASSRSAAGDAPREVGLALPHRPDGRAGAGVGPAAAARRALRRRDLHAARST